MDYTDLMIIFGVDPGTATTGWAAISGDRHKQKLLVCGSIITSKLKDHSTRLEEIYDQLSQKIKEFKPDVLAIEKLFFNTNQKTALMVGQTHGVVRLAAVKAGIKTIEYTPLEVKMAITGYGRAEKKQIQYMIGKLLKLEKPIIKDDIADAVAIALCHCYNSGKGKA